MKELASRQLFLFIQVTGRIVWEQNHVKIWVTLNKGGYVIVEKYAKVMGVQFPKITLDHTVEILSNVIEQNRSQLFHVITVNPEITMACQKDRSLRSIIDEAGLITAMVLGL